MTSEEKQVFTLRIAEANSAQLIVILYEMALSYLQEAGRGLEEEDIPAFDEGIRRGRECINELLSSLDCRYEVGKKLAGLYFYCLRELARGKRAGGKRELSRVIGILTQLRDAYGQVADASEGKPLMQHTQQVYAGMTYGKNALSHTVEHTGGTRGLLV